MQGRGRGHSFLLPVLCVQPGVGCGAGLEAEGLVLLGGVALGGMVSIPAVVNRGLTQTSAYTSYSQQREHRPGAGAAE